MARVEIIDRISLKDAGVRKTRDGYLVATPRVARTGIQEYAGYEVGMKDMAVVKVYRPPEQVFNTDSMATFAFKPITNDHPNKPVNPATWKDVTVGLAGGEVARDGDFIRVPMTVMDGAAIKDVEDGKSELSVGYSTELKWEKGTDPSTGEAYDAIQTNIIVNHVAIVDAARGGVKLKIGDQPASDPHHETADAGRHDEEEDTMNDKTGVSVMVDGIACTMDTQTASIVNKVLGDLKTTLASTTADVTRLTTQAADATKAHEAAVAKLTVDHKTAIDAKDAEIVTLKKAVEDAAITPEKLQQMVADRVAIIGKGKAVLGDKLVHDKKTNSEIMRQVVDSHLADKAKGWSDDQIKIAFDTMTDKVKVDDKTTLAPGVTDAANAFQAGPAGTAQPGNWNADAKAKTYGERDKKISERWKGEQKTA